MIETRFQSDSNEIPWLIRDDDNFSVGVSLLDSGRWFTEHSRNRWRAEYQEKLQELATLTLTEQRSQLRGIAAALRFGRLSTRIVWLIHSELMRARATSVRIPACYIRDIVWGERVPSHWRQELRKILKSISALHIVDHQLNDDSTNDFGDTSSLITHFNVPGRGKACQCDCNCIYADKSRAHEHVQVSVGMGFLGKLESITNGDGSGGLRKLRLPSPTDNKTVLVQNEKLLKDAGKSGRLTSIFLPAILGDRDHTKRFSTTQRQLFHLIFRERTRSSKKHRSAVAATETFTGDMVRSTKPNRKGAKSPSIRCPFLSPSVEYVGFNGNRVRKGQGYLVSTWQDRAGYSSTSDFLDDLKTIAELLGLIVASIDQKMFEWRQIDELRGLNTAKPAKAKRQHLRIYSMSNFESRWCSLFGWAANAEHDEQCRSARLASLFARFSYSQSYWARRLQVDPSALSKMIRGKRQCSEELLLRAVSLQHDMDN